MLWYSYDLALGNFENHTLSEACKLIESRIESFCRSASKYQRNVAASSSSTSLQQSSSEGSSLLSRFEGLLGEQTVVYAPDDGYQVPENIKMREDAIKSVTSAIGNEFKTIEVTDTIHEHLSIKYNISCLNLHRYKIILEEWAKQSLSKAAVYDFLTEEGN